MTPVKPPGLARFEMRRGIETGGLAGEGGGVAIRVPGRNLLDPGFALGQQTPRGFQIRAKRCYRAEPGDRASMRARVQGDTGSEPRDDARASRRAPRGAGCGCPISSFPPRCYGPEGKELTRPSHRALSHLA